MFQIDPLILLLISLLTAISTFIFCVRTKNIEAKLLIFLPSLTIFFYGGVGISFDIVDNKYFINYALVLLCFQGTLWLFVRNAKESPFFQGEFYSFLSNSRVILQVFSIVFFVTLFLSLCYPVFRLNLLWNPPTPSIFGIHDFYDTMRVSFANNILSYINIITKPFFYIYLVLLILYKKKHLCYILLLLSYYLTYLQSGYMGRYQFVLMVFFLYFVFKIKTGKNKQLIFQFGLKNVLILFVGFLALIPFFLWYVYFRSGYSSMTIGQDNFLLDFIETECYYPIYYSDIEHEKFFSIKEVLLWILCLPIPSAFIPNKPTLPINEVFTAFISGKLKGDVNYSGSLPSFVAETIMCFGPYLYFFHAILIAAVCGVIYRVLLKVNTVIILRLSLILTLMTIGRGGSVGPLSSFVNGTYFLLLVLLGFYIWNRKLAVVTEKI